MNRPELQSVQRIRNHDDVYEARVLTLGHFPGYYVVKGLDTGQMQTVNMSQMLDLDQKGDQSMVLDPQSID